MKKDKKDSKTYLRANIQEKQFDNFFICAPLIIVILTIAVYFKSLNNQFLVNWDDNVYVTTNNDIRNTNDKDFLKKTFTDYVHGNYHPLTMLSLSMDYKKHKLDPKAYHKTNLNIHILNSLLVFLLIWLLTKQKWVSFITSVLFAIHPMHIESVAWISERKDLLYSFFFLAALCLYTLYCIKEKNKIVYYSAALILFVFSTLSKGMAASFPFILFIIDFYLDKKITLKRAIDKVPFLLIAVIMGFVALDAQKAGNALYIHYDLIDRLLFAGYAVLLYIYKL